MPIAGAPAHAVAKAGGWQLKEIGEERGGLWRRDVHSHRVSSLFTQRAYKRPEIHTETHGSDQ
jgi:hypothetical protein